jgi:translation initiation factor IF-3
VKASIFFRGRSIQFAQQGEKQLLRFAVELEEFGRAENMPVLEGKRMSMMIAPVKKK